jgi:ketosteroid isomerase-like protein
MTATKLVNEYLSAFYSGDFETAGAVLADDFHFMGPFIEATSKDSYLSSAARLATIVRGHHRLRQWQDAQEVCSIYEVCLETSVGAGTVFMSEWHTVREGKLASSRLVFDTAAFRALMPPQ